MKIFKFRRRNGQLARRAGVLLSLSSALLAGNALTGPAASAVSHGDDTSAGQAPWMATVAFTGADPLVKRSYCGGTLIAPDRVVTAGHCVRGKLPADFEVYLGADKLSESQGKAHEVRGWFWHEEWREINTEKASWAANDLAVVMLAEPVRDVQPVAIADAEDVATAVAEGATGTVYGHGMTDKTDPKKGGMADRLQQAQMKLLPPAQCAPAIPDDVANSGFCTTGVPPAPEAPTPNVCPGDSGGPFILSTSDGPRLVGVLSAENVAGCNGNPKKQGAFADISGWKKEALRSDPELAPTANLQLNGTPAVGQKLEMEVTALKPKDAKVSYTWYEQKKDETGFTYYVPIEGATEPTFTVPKRLVGTPLSVSVELSNSAGEVMLDEFTEPVRR